MTEMRYERLRPHEIEARVEELPVIYCPFGSLEWHGWHNPLGLDTIKARALCLRAGEGGGVVAPANDWPVGGMPHPWTIRMSGELIHDLAVAIFQQMAHVGFRAIVALTGHYGLEQVIQLKQAAIEVMQAGNVNIAALAEYELALDAGYRGDHAAKWETSLTQHLFPELVDMSLTEPEGQAMDGVSGDDPRTEASPELGEKTATLIVDRLAGLGRRLATQANRDRAWLIQVSGMQTSAIRRCGYSSMSHEAYRSGVEQLWEGRYAEALESFRAMPA
jgi:creatinine amidohydrolase